MKDVILGHVIIPSYKQQVPIAPSHLTRLDKASAFQGKCVMGSSFATSAHQGELLSRDGGRKRSRMSLE